MNIFFKKIINIYFFIFLIWILAFLNIFLPFINHFGIKPRTLEGLIGIPLSVFLHADLQSNPYHIINNTIFLILLIPFLYSFYPAIAKKIIYYIVFISGFLIWLFGRPYNHIGASSLIFGLMFFLLFSGVFRKNLKSISSALLLILSYGIMINGMIPYNLNDFFIIIENLFYSIYSGIFLTEENVSWEAHLFGSISGLIAAYQYRYYSEIS